MNAEAMEEWTNTKNYHHKQHNPHAHKWQRWRAHNTSTPTTGAGLKLGNGHARNRYYNPLTQNNYTHNKYYIQKENPVRAVSIATHTLEWKHLYTCNNGVRDKLKRALMAAVNQTEEQLNLIEGTLPHRTLEFN